MGNGGLNFSSVLSKIVGECFILLLCSVNCKQFPSHNMVKHDASCKKGKLLCCKRIFDRVKANLAEIQPENNQNVQKTYFLQKAPGVNGLTNILGNSQTVLLESTYSKPNESCTTWQCDISY